MAELSDMKAIVEPGRELTDEQILRYSRHLLIPDIDNLGQRRINNAKVLCVGAGGLGSPTIMYLAAAGVGTIGIVDYDKVEMSNLQRQVIHGQSDIGKSKAVSAKEKVAELNPDVIKHIYNMVHARLEILNQPAGKVSETPKNSKTVKTNTRKK